MNLTPELQRLLADEGLSEGVRECESDVSLRSGQTEQQHTVCVWECVPVAESQVRAGGGAQAAGVRLSERHIIPQRRQRSAGARGRRLRLELHKSIAVSFSQTLYVVAPPFIRYIHTSA